VIRTADIVIVGGGVVGTSIAYHLARRGAGAGVVVLERDRLGAGTTAASGGGIRSQFSTDLNIRFSLESVAFWRRFVEEMGSSCDYRENGYLFLAQTPAEREMFERNVAFQNTYGVPSRFIEPDDAAQLVPGMRTDDLTGCAYSAEDGRASPNEVVQAFARRARENGVQIEEGVGVTAIDAAGGKIRAVDTTNGRIETPVVVNAAGPWAAAIGRLAGVDVPVTPYRRTTFISEPFDGVPSRIPLVIDLHVGWDFQREGEGIYLSGTKDPRPSFDLHVDWDGLAWTVERARHRVPAFEGLRIGKKAYAGLYDTSPDAHAILGPVPGVDGFHLACGFTGHGFQHSPATGRLIAEQLLDGRTTGIDIGPLSVDRFRTGALLTEPLTVAA
jgi:sarcosine oxidase subunit beta